MARILVIDDDSQIREMLTQFFERAGYEVWAAPNGQAALELHRITPADLIITDIFMPEKEGIEPIMEFCRNFPAVKIIGISGGGRKGKMGAEEYLKIAKVLGAQKTFSKPFELAKLLEGVRELLQK